MAKHAFGDRGVVVPSGVADVSLRSIHETYHASIPSRAGPVSIRVERCADGTTGVLVKSVHDESVIMNVTLATLKAIVAIVEENAPVAEPTRRERRAAILAQIETTKKCPQSVERDLYLRVLGLERDLVDAYQIADHFQCRAEKLRAELTDRIADRYANATHARALAEKKVAAIEADHRDEGALPVCDPVSAPRFKLDEPRSGDKRLRVHGEGLEIFVDYDDVPQKETLSKTRRMVEILSRWWGAL